MKLIAAASLLGSILGPVWASPIGAVSPNVTYGRVETDANGDVISHVVLEYVGDNLVESRSIERRSALSVPGTCSFGGKRSQFQYAHYSDASYLVPGKKGDCCMGWEEGTSTCHNINKWNQASIADIKSSMDKQIKKDGQFKSSSSGHWKAVFPLFTTAFQDSTPELWNKMVTVQLAGGGDNIDRSDTYYYGRHVPGHSVNIANTLNTNCDQ